MKHPLHLLLLTLTLLSPLANAAESTPTEPSAASKPQTTAYDITHISLPIIAAGMAFTPLTDEFKNLRYSYLGESHTSADDYTQYLPAALMLSLKAAGVESRSSWGRMLTADAFAIGMVTLLTNSIKNTTNVARPDTGATNSFPSGHTATAFMTATMLHKEYGAVNKWYSIGGYTVASATGLMRVLNNRHWIRDVMVGAGIGILSTEIAYLLSDLIFRDRGINENLVKSSRPSWHEIERPSMVGIYMGGEVVTSYNTDSATIETGATIGLEGAYFFNKYVGLGGRATISNHVITLNSELSTEELNTASYTLGGYFALPITPLIRLSTKALGGISTIETSHLTLSTGVAAEYLANRHFVMKAFCDYNTTPRNMQSVAFGVSAAAIF